MYRLSPDRELTPLLIQKYIQKNRQREAHLEMLYDYYKGNTAITKRVLQDASKPNNKVMNAYSSYIVDTYTGYFLGEPVNYASTDNEELLERITELFNYNDEAAINAELAKDASIFGCAYELMYMDSDANIRFKKIDATKIIPIYDNTLEEELLYCIRTMTKKILRMGIKQHILKFMVEIGLGSMKIRLL